MSGDARPVSVKILDKEYLISCEESEREQLHTAVSLLNEKMQDVKNTGKLIGAERIAVMTALNIASELLSYKRENYDYTNSIDTTVRRLRDKIDDALTKGGQLEM